MKGGHRELEPEYKWPLGKQGINRPSEGDRSFITSGVINKLAVGTQFLNDQLIPQGNFNYDIQLPVQGVHLDPCTLIFPCPSWPCIETGLTSFLVLPRTAQDDTSLAV